MNLSESIIRSESGNEEWRHRVRALPRGRSSGPWESESFGCEGRGGEGHGYLGLESMDFGFLVKGERKGADLEMRQIGAPE